MSAAARRPETRINGVSVSALYDTVDAIRAKGSMARYQFRARNQWLDGGHTRTSVKDYFGAGAEQTSRPRPFVVDSDTPTEFRGDDRAMDPLELFLASLASCMTTTVVWHAAVRGIHVEAVETRVEGDIDFRGWLGLDRDREPGYEEIRVAVKLEAEASDAELDKLVQLTATYSPLFDTVSRGTRVLVERER